MVAGDLVHQGILEDRQSVAQSNGDVAPQVFPGLEEQAVVPLAGWSGGSWARMLLISLMLLWARSR